MDLKSYECPIWGLSRLHRSKYYTRNLTCVSVQSLTGQAKNWQMDWMLMLWIRALEECSQPRMCESRKVKDHNGYLGRHQHTLSVGDTQSFIFKSTDVGPFWMTIEKRELNCHDRLLPPLPGNPRTRNKTIAELKSELAPLNLLNDWCLQYRLTELLELVKANNVDNKVIRAQEKKVDKASHLFHVLWERGWIDEGQQIKKYTMDLAKDDDGKVLEGPENWSLKCHMACCLGFAEELVMALQHVGNELGALVLITPNFMLSWQAKASNIVGEFQSVCINQNPQILKMERSLSRGLFNNVQAEMSSQPNSCASTLEGHKHTSETTTLRFMNAKGVKLTLLHST